jgi:CDP-4-dehydro-6-deoxyglucose reductase, E3
MTNDRNVTIRGRRFRVRAGDVLLDGALANGVDIPHDCRAGTCGTCMVQVVKGQTVCEKTHTQGMVHACQARVVSDLEVEMEDVPEIETTRARLAGLRELAPDIVELAIAPEKEPICPDNISVSGSTAFRPAPIAPPSPWRVASAAASFAST